MRRKEREATRREKEKKPNEQGSNLNGIGESFCMSAWERGGRVSVGARKGGNQAKRGEIIGGMDNFDSRRQRGEEIYHPFFGGKSGDAGL